MPLTERQQLIIYVKSHKNERAVRKYGHIVHVNRKEKWISMYVDKDKADQVVSSLMKLKFVTDISGSPYQELKRDYSDSRQESLFHRSDNALETENTD